jgi:hypothetical protein
MEASTTALAYHKKTRWEFRLNPNPNGSVRTNTPMVTLTQT